MKKILVIGAVGQIGSELTMELRRIYGNANVIASDLRKQPPSTNIKDSGPFEFFDILNKQAMYDVCRKHRVDCIVNLAAILSAAGEQNPLAAWDINMNGLVNVLEIAREMKMEQVLCPSSIAVFGQGTPLDFAPQETVLHPSTMYGITKVAGELLGDYYVRKYGLDVRGLRFPGIISHETLPGGGTTDYAVAIYYAAVKQGRYTCFVKEDTRLPMMYMPDCLKAIVDLMHADFTRLRHHTDFNVGAMSFSVKEMADSIKRYMPDFTIDYEPDFHQAIADSWPDDVDDTAARNEWGWKPGYDLGAMTQDMLKVLGEKHKRGLI